MIDKANNDIAALPTHDIRAPSHAKLLSARLDAAFSNDVLKSADSWCQQQEVETMLGNKSLQFRDMREILRFAMQTLTHQPANSTAGLIPGISGTNMRNALTLYRAIMKSIDVVELFKLSRCKDVTGGHYLIKVAALERYPCYFASRSKIQNILDPSISEFYFAKVYLLKVFQWLSHGSEYLSLKKWFEGAMHVGLTEKSIKEEVWNMLTEEYAYVEVEGFEDGLPDVFHYIDDLPANCKVRISPSGKYYMEWLVHDISYLDCIMQDTLMDTRLAQELASMRTSDPFGVVPTFDRVYKFLDYLKQQETIEQSSFGRCESISPVVEEIWRRVDLQKTSLIRL